MQGHGFFKIELIYLAKVRTEMEVMFPLLQPNFSKFWELFFLSLSADGRVQFKCDGTW
jgi:hypothetical protein